MLRSFQRGRVHVKQAACGGIWVVVAEDVEMANLRYDLSQEFAAWISGRIAQPAK